MCGNLTRLKIDHKLEKYEMKSISLTSVYSAGAIFFIILNRTYMNLWSF